MYVILVKLFQFSDEKCSRNASLVIKGVFVAELASNDKKIDLVKAPT